MYQELVTLISSVGFPIVACIFMYKQNTNTLDKMTDTINELKETITELKGVIEREH